MKTILLFFSILLCISDVMSQRSEPSWYFTIDAFNVTDISDLEMDNEGNTYVVANYQGALHLEGNQGRVLPPAPHVHGVLIKLNPQGKLLWCHGFKSAFDNRINDLDVGPDGSVYITGFGDGLMHFPGKTDNMIVGRERAAGEFHQPQGLYAAKYSKDGERIWVNYWSTTWGEGKSIAVNSKGEVVFSYYHYSRLTKGDEVIDDFTRTPEAQAKVSRAFLHPDGKLNRIETFQILNSDSNVRTPQLLYDDKDQLYSFGLFKKSIYLSENDSLTNDGYYDGHDSYLVKYDQEGKLDWVKQFGGQNMQIIEDIDIAEDGSIYGTGQYSYECILMENVKSVQKSKYEYKSGNSFFYFHFFDDGETDFIRFQEGNGYNGYFMGFSVDHDVNGETHIIGSFTDTLHIDGFQLESPTYPSFGFVSQWEGTSLVDLHEMASMEKSWINPCQIRSSEKGYAIGAIYYGDDVMLEIGGKKVKLGFKDYGRASVVYGGAIRKKEDRPEVLAEQRQSRRVERLRSLEPLLSCTDAKLADDPATWYLVAQTVAPSLNPSAAPPASEPAATDPLTGLEPCGMQVADLEATLFPNPSAGPINVRLKGMEGGTAQLDIFSESGQLIYSQRILVPTNDYQVNIDLTASAAGNYIVRIVHGEFEKGLRLVKMKI